VPILTDEQRAFLIALDPTDLQPDGQAERDQFEFYAINVVTALDTYGVTGEQFASIVVDLMAGWSMLVTANPNGVSATEMRQAVARCVATAALAYRHHRDTHPDA